jgi:hypothetical protein
VEDPPAIQGTHASLMVRVSPPLVFDDGDERDEYEAKYGEASGAQQEQSSRQKERGGHVIP